MTPKKRRPRHPKLCRTCGGEFLAVTRKVVCGPCLDRRNHQKNRARQMASNAIRAGKLVRQPCEACGLQEGAHAHHEDYSRPLDVRWLCGSCHSWRHNALRGDEAGPIEEWIAERRAHEPMRTLSSRGVMLIWDFEAVVKKLRQAEGLSAMTRSIAPLKWERAA